MITGHFIGDKPAIAAKFPNLPYIFRPQTLKGGIIRPPNVFRERVLVGLAKSIRGNPPQKFQFPRPMHLRVAGQNLFHQGRTRTRQSNDEHGCFIATPAAVVPPDATTAAKASVGVTAFTRKIDASITCGDVPSEMCRVVTVRPTVKYASAREIASLRVNSVPAGNTQSRNCAGVCIRIKIRGRRLRRIAGAEAQRNLTF